jgi:hypothetical protein
MTIDATPDLMICAPGAWLPRMTDARVAGCECWLRQTGSAIRVIRLPVRVIAGFRAESGILPVAA